MNKRILLGVVALATMFVLNTRHALNDYGVRENQLHVAILAQTNTTTGSGTTGSGTTGGGTTGGGTTGGGTSSSDPEWNPWYLWFSQGFTKDEREEKRDCPISSSSNGSGNVSGGGASAGASGGTSQTNPSGRWEIVCPYGSSNCTKIGC